VSVICERPVQDYSGVFGLGAKWRGFIGVDDFQLTFSFLVEVKTANTAFVVLSFNFHVWSGGIHLRLPSLCFAPLPLFVSLH